MFDLLLKDGCYLDININVTLATDGIATNEIGRASCRERV